MSYIDELREQGKLDSVGSFTIDLLRSRAILYRNSLPDPKMYVLKLIQGLVALEPTRIEILHSSTSLELFAAEARPLARAHLDQTLAAGDGDLVLGLGAALASGQAVEVSQGGPAGWSLFENQSREPGPGLLVRTVLDHPPTRELELIQERCQCCPIALTVAGIPLTNDPWTYPKRMLESVQTGSPTRVTIAPFVRAEVIDAKSRPWFYLTLPLYLREVAGELVQGGPASTPVVATSAVSLSTGLTGPCWLHLVRRGVLLEPIALPLDFGGEVLLNGDNLAVDLGGLTANDSPELAAATTEACRLLRLAAGSALEHFARIQQLPVPPPPVTYRRIGAITVIAVVTFFVAIFIGSLFFYLDSFSAILAFAALGVLIVGMPVLIGTPSPATPLHWKMNELQERLRKLESL